MGRTQRALTSLIGAIPAGFLLYLLVIVFLRSSDKLSTVLMVIVGMTLVCAFVVVLMPFGLLVLGGKKAEKVEKEAPAKAAKEEDSDEVAVADEEESESVSEIEEAIEEEEGSDFDIGESDAEIMSDSDDEITGSTSSLDEIEAVDFDDEDEPPAPKKRKK